MSNLEENEKPNASLPSIYRAVALLIGPTMEFFCFFTVLVAARAGIPELSFANGNTNIV